MNHAAKALLSIIWIAGALVASTHSYGQTYPDKPIRLVVGFTAGGPTDILARTIGDSLNQAFRQPVIVDNRPGAASNIAADYVAKSPADGYTLMFGSQSLANNATLYAKLPYNALRDFAPIVRVANTPFMLCVHPSLPAANIRELVAFAQARPGQVQYGSAGNGSAAHLFTEHFASMAGLRMQNIPYKGAVQATADLMAGQVALVFENVIAMVPLSKSGKVRCLAVSTQARTPLAPEIPTMSEAGVTGYVADVWFGLFAPTGTPAAAIQRLNAEVNNALKQPALKQRFETLGCEAAGGTPEAFAAYFRADIEKWGKVIRAAGVRLD
jgi:tripartite-type tricarboxylate transporter receptor subunit TctC